MGILRSLGGAFLAADRLQVDASLCLRSLSPLSDCQICQDLCPEKLISLASRGPIIDNACTACGLCAKNCPTTAIRMAKPLRYEGDDEGRVVLYCREDPSFDASFNALPCFSSLRIEELLELWQHFQEIVFAANCEQCDKKFEPMVITGLLARHGIDAQEKISFVEDPVQGSQNRRDFLKSLLGQMAQWGQGTGTRMLESYLPGMQPETGKIVLPLQSLRRHYQEQGLEIDHDLPYFILDCLSCSFCGACVHVCPSDALRLSEDEDFMTLYQDPGACISCKLCQKVCYQGDLRFSRSLRPADLLKEEPRILAGAGKQCCPSCGEVFYGEKDAQCSLCQRKA